MAKYRMLSFEELNELQQEFVSFLAANSVTADDWVALKKEEPAKAKKMIELFSDVVFEGVVRKVQFLDHRTEDRVTSFQVLDDKLLLISFTFKEKENINLSDSEAIKALTQSDLERGELISTEKPFANEKGQEVFDLLQKGCEISDGTLFKTLWMLKAENNATQE